jgi:hypothetical protein
MRRRCMTGFEIGPESPCSTISQVWLNPGYGFGAPAAIERNREASNPGHRKCLAANWICGKLCQDATQEPASRRPGCHRSPRYPGASPTVSPP